MPEQVPANPWSKWGLQQRNQMQQPLQTPYAQTPTARWQQLQQMQAAGLRQENLSGAAPGSPAPAPLSNNQEMMPWWLGTGGYPRMFPWGGNTPYQQPGGMTPPPLPYQFPSEQGKLW